ncbi:thiolase family protein [Phreatobacter stygius]|uniref:Thiolase family protein n=1 Tax=Phreatobacter stygius TaxID=1940610 RepID=A0A4D7B8Z7_9HYPH|nr:thiolase family protein [Phreatobacter stygius]QCI66940.1 thiolase family protein [Phreatobacter stygius]
MSDVYIVGVGMTVFGRFLDTPLKALAGAAITEALEDAGLARDAVEAAFFANTAQGVVEGQHLVAGQIALRDFGFQGIPVTNVENACASASTALNAAVAYVKSGQGDVALAVGAEKMNAAERERSFAIFDGAWDVHDVERTIATLTALGKDLPLPAGAGQNSGMRSVFMDVYAALARFHMHRFGTTQADIAAVSAKNHRHSQHNEKAHYRQPMTVEEVLAAREISWPLTLPMCAPISDGAAAAIVCSGQKARELGLTGRAVRIAATVMATGSDRRPEEFDRHLCRRAADRAYAIAGVGPSDIHVAEVHDASAFAELQQVELLGFCALGEGGRLAREGATTLGGRIPVNVSGGLESRGHPIGATGLAQIYELVAQLRHEAGPRQVEGARLAIAENGGGFHGIEEATACITILQR